MFRYIIYDIYLYGVYYIMQKKTLSLKFSKNKKKFIKFNNFFLNKIIFCTVFDPLVVNLEKKANKFCIDHPGLTRLSEYSKNFKIKKNIIQDLIYFTKFQPFIFAFDSIFSLKEFLRNKKNLKFYFISIDFNFFFIKDHQVFFDILNHQKNRLLSFFFFFFLKMLTYFFIFFFNLNNYTRNRNDVY